MTQSGIDQGNTAMKLPAALAAATLALAGCMTVPDTHPLAGTEWQLVAIDTSGSTTTLTPALQPRHTIAFADGGFRTSHQVFAGKDITKIGSVPLDDHGTMVASIATGNSSALMRR